MTQTKTGLYLCEGCGIAQAVDCGDLERIARTEFKAAHCVRHAALCSEQALEGVRQDLAAGTVDRLAVAACSPRVMADRFRFDGATVVRASLREHVAWSQAAGDENTRMLGADQVRMALAQLSKTSLPAPSPVADAARAVLVVGGGVSGLTAALEAARSGYPVLLVERSDRLGGWSAHWSRRMPHLPPYREPRPNDIERLIGAVRAERRIQVMMQARVTRTSGAPGRFEVTISRGGADTTETVGAIVVATGWRPYDATRLADLGYGAPDVVTGVEFEAMLRDGGPKRSSGAPARSVAFLQCAGSRKPDHLPYCSSVCCGVSIKQAIQVVRSDPDASAYILYEELRTPGTAEEFYREAQRSGVIFIKGRIRQVDAGHMTVTYEDQLLGADVPLGGLDLIVLATGMVPNSTDLDAPVVEPEKSAEQLKADIDPVAPIRAAGLAAATAPASPAVRAAAAPPPGGPILNLQYRQGPHIPILADGFPDSHYICFPYETRRTGIYTCGPVRRPMDMAESAEDATGAVLKAIQAIEAAGAGSAVHPRVGDLSFPRIGLDICTKCRRCTVECPFGAIDEEADGRPVVNTSRCRRCGTCMGACPVRTITFDNYSPQMVAAMIQANEIPDEFSEKPRILLLACENDAYPAIDMAAFNRSRWSPFVRIIPVRCLGSVTMLWVSTALEKGYDGVMLMGCKSGDDYQCHFVKGSGLARERMAKISETLKSMMLEQERVAFEEVSIADSRRVPQVINTFAELIGALEPNPMKGF